MSQEKTEVKHTIKITLNTETTEESIALTDIGILCEGDIQTMAEVMPMVIAALFNCVVVHNVKDFPTEGTRKEVIATLFRSCVMMADVELTKMTGEEVVL